MSKPREQAAPGGDAAGQRVSDSKAVSQEGVEQGVEYGYDKAVDPSSEQERRAAEERGFQLRGAWIVTVSQGLGAALTARRCWCQPGEPILWAVWQVRKTYRVDGCTENGFRKQTEKQSVGKRFARAAGKAAAEVGGAVAVGILTAAFGGGDDSGKTSGGSTPSADLTVVGSHPDCAAMRWPGPSAQKALSRSSSCGC